LIAAHESLKSAIRVGRYGVNLNDLNGIVVPSMIPSNVEQVVIIDEIGKMECFSKLFRETLIRTLDSSNTLVGSIALKGGEFIRKMKSRADVKIILVNEQNRERLVDEVSGSFLNRPV
jgi:nucleoside-triphosphatase